MTAILEAPPRAATLLLLRYGIFGLPLAFAGLPIYVHVPKFYAEGLGVPLEAMGILLLALRLLDSFLDPWIGLLSDCYRAFRPRIMALSLPVFAASYVGLFAPPDAALGHPLAWLGCMLALVYASFSTLMINYYAAGLGLAEHPHDHTRISAWREGMMLIGVLLASLLPTLFAQHYDLRGAYLRFSLLLPPLLLVAALFGFSTLGRLPEGAQTSAGFSFFKLLRLRPVWTLLVLALCNSVPTAITSTLFLFFTKDILHAEPQSGPMLCVYFLAAAGGMPFWVMLSKRFTRRISLLAAMAAAIACFGWAYALGPGDSGQFTVICVLSGMTLGADLALLPALFADTLAFMPEAGSTAFGLWNFTSKLTLALAAGVVLPLLGLAGYVAGGHNTSAALAWLSFSYAILPCGLKAVAWLWLYFLPLDASTQGVFHASVRA